MISFDNILIAFSKENLYSIMLVLGLLKILAKYSDNNTDDEIITYLMNIFKK